MAGRIEGIWLKRAHRGPMDPVDAAMLVEGKGVQDSANFGSFRQVTIITLERWLDKRGLAEHLSCSVRSIQTGLAEGMPHAVIFGRVKFQVSEVEPWLEAHGYLVRHGAEIDGTLARDIKRAGDADTPRPRTRGEVPHAS